MCRISLTDTRRRIYRICTDLCSAYIQQDAARIEQATALVQQHIDNLLQSRCLDEQVLGESLREAVTEADSLRIVTVFRAFFDRTCPQGTPKQIARR